MIVDKHKIYLKMARDYSQMSKCRKIKVGCLIVNNGRIISTGANGVNKGACDCTDHIYAHDDEQFAKAHHEWSKDHEIHAEMNAILYTAKSNAEINSDCILYCTHEPCNNCLKHIAVTGIKQIYFIEKYYGNTIDNKYKLDIKQLSLDEDEVVTKQIQHKPFRQRTLVRPHREIIVNARKVMYEYGEMYFDELVEMCFGQVEKPEMYHADFLMPFGKNGFETFLPHDKVMIWAGMQFRCSGTTPVYPGDEIPPNANSWRDKKI